MFGLAFVGAIVLIFGVLWLRTIIDLLRQGPGNNPVWWAGCLAVVVFLGPVGAIAYWLANLDFDRAGNPRRRPPG